VSGYVHVYVSAPAFVCPDSRQTFLLRSAFDALQWSCFVINVDGFWMLSVMQVINSIRMLFVLLFKRSRMD